MTERYDIVLYGQLGERFGTLCWTENGGDVKGTFSLMGVDNPVTGKMIGPNLELFHALCTAVSTLSCHTSALIQGDFISGIVSFKRGNIKMSGKRRRV